MNTRSSRPWPESANADVLHGATASPQHIESIDVPGDAGYDRFVKQLHG
ncbi:hypothetical protein [Streptomyces sp. H27-C3]|nr:hypothetical protein [Streptomyces sp. H27-C3]MDJ0464272.1 hypothetical protein [Streptomyces sp. H27-C3]